MVNGTGPPFLEVLLMLGGPRIATFVATNQGGPEIHSTYRWRNHQRVWISGGIQETNFRKLGPLYKETMANIIQVLFCSSVPVLDTEVETAIIGRVTYHKETNEHWLVDNNMHALIILLLWLEMARKVSRLLLMPPRNTRLTPLFEQYCLTHSV